MVKSPRNPHLRGMRKMALKPESKLARWRGRGEEPGGRNKDSRAKENSMPLKKSKKLDMTRV